MMLDDLDYVESITNMIETQQVNAEFAVASTGDNFAQMFAAMDDDYMRERAADVKDISNRVISILQGNGDAGLSGDEPFILLADDLAPSETVQLDKSKVTCFCNTSRFHQFPHGDLSENHEYSGADRCAGGARQSPFRYDGHRRWQGCRVLRGSG